MKNLKGVLLAAGSYIMWGLLPLYWKAIHGIPALELLAHRIAWSLIFLGVISYFSSGFGWFKQVMKSPKLLMLYTLAGALLGVNWFLYIWAVVSDHMIDASLGYFITPLFSISMGILFLKEKIRKIQLIAIILAALGVIYLTIVYGTFPWVGIGLAVTFSVYGLIKKTGVLGSIESLSFETVVLFIPAVAFLIWQEVLGVGSFGHTSLSQNLLLILSGAATSTPLLLFGAGSRLIPLSSLGFLQYIAPTLQFLIGVVIYKEAFETTRAIGFSFIWVALALYTIDLIVNKQRVLKKAA